MINNSIIKKHLPLTPVLANNTGLTKNQQRHSNVLNIAFFVPKIHQAWYLLKGIKFDLGARNEVRISKYGRVNEQNTIPVYSGNMFGRLLAISDTRSPVAKTGEQILLKPTGGQTMPLNTSKRATISTIHTVYTSNGIIATIHTRYNQKAVIGRLFASFEQLKGFIQSQGLNLDLLGGRA